MSIPDKPESPAHQTPVVDLRVQQVDFMPPAVEEARLRIDRSVYEAADVVVVQVRGSTYPFVVKNRWGKSNGWSCVDGGDGGNFGHQLVQATRGMLVVYAVAAGEVQHRVAEHGKTYVVDAKGPVVVTVPPGEKLFVPASEDQVKEALRLGKFAWTSLVGERKQGEGFDEDSVLGRLDAVEEHVGPRNDHTPASIVNRIEALEKISHAPFDFTELLARVGSLEKALELKGARLSELQESFLLLENQDQTQAWVKNSLNAIENRLADLEKRDHDAGSLGALQARMERYERDPAFRDYRELLGQILEDVAKVQGEVRDLGRLVHPVKRPATKPVKKPKAKKAAPRKRAK